MRSTQQSVGIIVGGFAPNIILFYSKNTVAALYKIIGIFDSCCLVRRVHSQLWKADIHCIHRHLGHGNVAQRRSPRHIGPVGKSLKRNSCPAADILKHSSRIAIGTVFLIRAVFDDDSLIEKRHGSPDRPSPYSSDGPHGHCLPRS